MGQAKEVGAVLHRANPLLPLPHLGGDCVTSPPHTPRMASTVGQEDGARAQHASPQEGAIWSNQFFNY